MNVQSRTLFIADNLDIMRGINSECIDLIYLDPPFNTNRNYKAPIGTPAESAEFKDIWTDLTEDTAQMCLPRASTHKHKLYGQQEGKCAGCNYFLPFRNMTIDHIVPQSKGGTDEKENLQLLCNACNSTKSTRSQSEFIAILREQGIRKDESTTA